MSARVARPRRLDERGRTPRLASDALRGWVIVAVAIPPTIAVPFLIPLTDGDIGAVAVAFAQVFVAWSCLALASTLVTLVVFSRASGPSLAEWMRRSTPRTRSARLLARFSGSGALSWAVTGSTLAVAAVIVLALNEEMRAEPWVFVPGIVVVVTSLSMIITAYAVHYARLNSNSGGAEFPRTVQPVFTDYLYLAVQVSTTFASSDVELTSTAFRRAVSLNSLISFAFNTVIVALLVSVLVSSAG